MCTVAERSWLSSYEFQFFVIKISDNDLSALRQRLISITESKMCHICLCLIASSESSQWSLKRDRAREIETSRRVFVFLI
jgi:hypothetical protein